MSAKSDVFAAITAAKPRITRVDVEGIATPFYVRSIPAWKRTQLEVENRKEYNSDGTVKKDSSLLYRASVIAATLCDESGEFLNFTTEEIAAINNADCLVLEPIFDAALVAVGFAEESRKAAEKK